MSDELNSNENVNPANAKSSLTEYVIEYIPLSDIEPDPNQPRKDFSDLQGLINSIELEGLIYPITVAPHPDETNNPGKYIIVDGGRRFKAYQELNKNAEDNQKYEKISARIIPSFEQRIGIIVNLMNKGYNCFEIADSIQLLLNEAQSKNNDFTQKELAKYLGKSTSNISEYMSLFKLPNEIQEQERNNPCVPFNQLKQLAAKKNSPQQKKDEYNELRSEYEEKSEKEKDDTGNQNTGKASSSEQSSQSKNRHYNALTKKLEGTSEALGKFEIKNITDDEKSKLNQKLDKIIADAKYMKVKLQKNANTESE